MAGRDGRTPKGRSFERASKSRGLRTSESHPSRHQRWYERHHAASKARSALRVWALRNRTRELLESGIALGSICLPKSLTVALHADARGDACREVRTLLLRELEASLVEGRMGDVKDGAEHLASEIIQRPSHDLDDLLDLGRAFDLIRDTGTFVRDPHELRQAFERQAAISRALDAYWYRLSSLDRRRFTPYLVKSFLHQASLWRIYGFLTDGSVEYHRAEELARHALQAIDAAGRGSENNETLQFFRFDALLWYGRIRGVHQRVYDREVVTSIDELGTIARSWPRLDIAGQWVRELSNHAVAAEGEGPSNYGDPVERALEAEAHFLPDLSTIPQLHASILRTKIEAYASRGKRSALEPDLSAATSLISEHRDAVWAQVLKRAVWFASRGLGRVVFSPEPDPFRLSSILLELYLELLRPSSPSPRSLTPAA